MQEIIVLRTEGKGAPRPEAEVPSPDKLLAGEYRTVTYNQWTSEGDRLFCGTWECTPGKVRIDHTEWEFCHLLTGEAVLSNEAGQTWRLRAGDGFIIPPGFKGTWETVSKVRKQYVILTRK